MAVICITASSHNPRPNSLVTLAAETVQDWRPTHLSSIM
jgi:hypothetical protein